MWGVKLMLYLWNCGFFHCWRTGMKVVYYDLKLKFVSFLKEMKQILIDVYILLYIVSGYIFPFILIIFIILFIILFPDIFFLLY